MESSKVLFEIDGRVLESKSELEAVYFTKPRLVAYYEDEHGVFKPAKKIYYFRNPTPEDYPINLNNPKNNALVFTYPTVLERESKYAMSSMFKKDVGNLEKMKIYTTTGTLTKVMYCYYDTSRGQQKFRVSRYNSDLYIFFGNKDFYSEVEHNEKQQQLFRRSDEIRNLFKGKFVVII